MKALVSDLIYTRTLDISTGYDVKPVFVTGLNFSEADIPFFAHPLLVKNNKGIPFLCTDIRPFISSNPNELDGFKPKNITEFNFIKSRTILNMAWLVGGVSQIRSSLPLAGMVFAGWLSETIAKRFALDPKDQLTIAVASHYYYQSLFSETGLFDEDAIQRMAIQTSSATKVDSKFIFEVFDKLKPMQNLQSLCDNIKEVTENIRLKDLNVGLLYNIVGNDWFGLNAKEIVAVALEHPPTWCALVYTALSERTFKNSNIARIAERYSKGNLSRNFTQSYVELVQSYISEKQKPMLSLKDL